MIGDLSQLRLDLSGFRGAYFDQGDQLLLLLVILLALDLGDLFNGLRKFHPLSQVCLILPEDVSKAGQRRDPSDPSL